MNTPDPTKHCTCPGDKVMRYHTDFRARTTLRCVKCGKPEQADTTVTFPAEPVPA